MNRRHAVLLVALALVCSQVAAERQCRCQDQRKPIAQASALKERDQLIAKIGFPDQESLRDNTPERKAIGFSRLVLAKMEDEDHWHFGAAVVTEQGVLTAAHVVEGAEEIWLVDVEKQAHPVTSYLVTAGKDIALLLGKDLPKMKGVAFANGKPSVGQEVVVFGCPHDAISIVRGRISNFLPDGQLTLPFGASGFSGGGVFAVGPSGDVRLLAINLTLDGTEGQTPTMKSRLITRR